MNALIDYITAHQAFLGITATHFIHLTWPHLMAAYPYAKENGGVVGIIKTFLFGKPQPQPENKTQ